MAEIPNGTCDQFSIPSIDVTHTTLNDNITNELKPQQTIDVEPTSSDILQPTNESFHTTIKSESSVRSFQTSEISTENSIGLNTFKSSKPVCIEIDNTNSLSLVIKDIEFRSSKFPQHLSIDLNLPFKRFQHSVADEIYASITSRPKVPYALLWEIDIPKPNCNYARRIGIPFEDIKDPRLRRIYFADNNRASEAFSTINGKRLDPRLKHVPDSLADITKKNNQKIQIALVVSDWYNNLPQDQQVLTNIQLDSLKFQLNNFHSNKTSDKKFDLSFVRQNILMQQVITNLGLNIDDNGLIQQTVCWEGDHTTYVFPSETRVMRLNNNYPAGSD